MLYETVIGLEVHVHLNTRTKAFCGCSTEFGQQPNSQVCPVCLGFPGSLPVLNKAALESAVKVGIALNCKIQEYTKFDRKNYFYPDLPKNYQISQYDLPVAKNGYVDISTPQEAKRIRITRAHLEEDAGKLLHQSAMTLVDYNRAGIPLLEIVTEPDIHSPEDAYLYLIALKSIIEYLDVSDCDMEKGSLRCDANISLRPRGVSELGTKAEIKNLNSFKAVRDALAYEVQRQQELLAEGGKIVQETRLWDEKKQVTESMRGKEEAQDYRYFPEPDLPPFILSERMIEQIRATIPELPQQKKQRFMRDFGISEYNAEILVASQKDAAFAEECIKLYPNIDKRQVVNWITGPLLAEINNRNCGLADVGLSPQALVELIAFVDEEKISQLVAKAVLEEMLSTRTAASQIIKGKNLIQISDDDTLGKAADAVISENPKSVGDFRVGKVNALMFLVGQVMRKTQGKANPKAVQEILKRKLEG